MKLKFVNKQRTWLTKYTLKRLLAIEHRLVNNELSFETKLILAKAFIEIPKRRKHLLKKAGFRYVDL